METKDILPIVVSFLALIVSLATYIINRAENRRGEEENQRAEEEKRRAIRNSLTETLNEISASSREQARLIFELYKDNRPLIGIANNVLPQQLMFLINQAVYLTKQEPSLVTAVDYNTIAVNAASLDDLTLAEEYYGKAIEACPEEGYYRAMAIRSFANFLFAQRRFEEGRGEFAKAAALFKGADNVTRYQKGLTYQQWGSCELMAKSKNKADLAFESAMSEYCGIDNDEVKKTCLANLDAAKARFAFPPQMPPPVPGSLAGPTVEPGR